MKVAILLGGPYRGNSQIIHSHLEFIGNYDTYLSCFEHYKYDWLRSSWPIKKIFTTPNVNFKETNWSKYRNDEPGQSGFWQFWNLKNVINNIEEDYDWYIKSRSDLLFYDGKLTEDMLKTLQPNTFYCPINYFDGQTWDFGKNLNDQFYIGDANVMRVVSNFVTKFYNKYRHSLNYPNFSNETALRLYLNENNINIVPITGIRYSKNHNGCTVSSGINQIFQLETIL
jgi:hypothetical protein